MNDLRELAQPLLDDPPHPPPPVDELRRRVGARRRRRARTIGGSCLVVLVVLVAAAVAAVVARDRDVVDVATGPAATEPPVPAPPPFAPGPVRMIVSPESAGPDTPRTIEVRNDSSDRWGTCGFAVHLFRWTGDTWEPFATTALIQDPPRLSEYEPYAEYDCNLTFLAAGTTTSLPFSPGEATWHSSNGTIPPRTDELPPGWYELRDREARANGEKPALGRFEITAPGTAPPTDPDRVTSTIDLFPDGVDAGYPESFGLPEGATVGPGTPVLPTDVVAVDRNTIALAWRGPCNQPATDIDVTRSAGEIELRLRVGSFFTIDCVGESDRWIATFDLPFDLADGDRVVARAPDGETARRPGPILGDSSGSWRLPHGMPISFQASVLDRTDEPGLSSLLIQLPWPLVTAGAACEATLSQQNSLVIPEVRVQLPTPDAPVPACSPDARTYPVADGTRVLGQP